MRAWEKCGRGAIIDISCSVGKWVKMPENDRAILFTLTNNQDESYSTIIDTLAPAEKFKVPRILSSIGNVMLYILPKSDTMDRLIEVTHEASQIEAYHSSYEEYLFAKSTWFNVGKRLSHNAGDAQRSAKINCLFFLASMHQNGLFRSKKCKSKLVYLYIDRTQLGKFLAFGNSDKYRTYVGKGLTSLADEGFIKIERGKSKRRLVIHENFWSMFDQKGLPRPPLKPSFISS